MFSGTVYIIITILQGIWLAGWCFQPYNYRSLFLPTMNQQQSTPTPDTVLEREVAAMIVAALNLEISADEIQPEATLFEDGLGLDSIDILEISLVISKTFGIQMKAENEDNFRTFSSLRSLTSHISKHRTK